MAAAAHIHAGIFKGLSLLYTALDQHIVVVQHDRRQIFQLNSGKLFQVLLRVRFGDPAVDLGVDAAYVDHSGKDQLGDLVVNRRAVPVAAADFDGGGGLPIDFMHIETGIRVNKKIAQQLQGKLSSSQEAWIAEIEKLVLGGTGVKALKITDKILEGDYHGAFKDSAKAIIGGMLGTVVKEQMGSTGGFVNQGDVAKYYLNLGWGIGTAGGELVMEPSWKNLGNLAWNATVQPVLDTAGSKIESVIKQIPGISEYYYDEHGAEDIGDAAGIALGDFYGLFSADEGIKEYGANYYKEGIWEGLWGGFEDISSFVKDSGGVGEAAKSFFDTAWKDTKANWGAFVENMEYLFKAETPEAVNVPLDSTSL